MVATSIKKDTATVIIDGVAFEFAPGVNLVDAAKQAGTDIPVFCYHPKMAPVGMCRMCLVEMGSVERDRETGQPLLNDDGSQKIRWNPKLQTACTQVVIEGMVVRTDSAVVQAARNDVLEFLLTSHPLDCPICDKGGECPLQNLTMDYRADTSRMYLDDKMHMEKHYPLGELIYLDRERCIQCARCTRFQAELVGDDVLAFHERGRRLQIITNSEPGFDSYFSGNTTDICPVGALTTADFRFGARPWELTNVPSISPYDPAGANTTLSTRIDRDFDGRTMIKRVMARQNEAVNEIWIDDKTRFGHHFTRSEAHRLLQPLVRNQNGALKPVIWGAALKATADLLRAANGNVAAIVGSGASNEDLWALRQLLAGLGSNRLGAWPVTHTGADLLAQVGVGSGTAFKELRKGDAVLVVASDLEEEAPMLRLRVKQAHDHGAAVFILNARKTRLDTFVRASERLRYAPGHAAEAMNNFAGQYPEAYEAIKGANNLIIIAGAEGLTLDGHRALMQAAANFLIQHDFVGRAKNGLIAPLPGPNAMGQHYLGYTPEATQDIIANPPQVLIVAQADVLEDDPTAAEWLARVPTVINLSLFKDELPDALAAVRLPIQSFAERDGTYTSVERRVQRFYVGQGPLGEASALWQIAERLREALGQGTAKANAAAVMLDITRSVPAFANCRYKELARTEVQYPLIGRADVYYGGTAYDNTGGLGVQIPSAAEQGAVSAGEVTLPTIEAAGDGAFTIVPTVELYNRERIFRPSIEALMAARVPAPYVEVNADDAARLGIADGETVTVRYNGGAVDVRASVNGRAPQGTLLLPRHLTPGQPTPMTITTGQLSKKG